MNFWLLLFFTFNMADVSRLTSQATTSSCKLEMNAERNTLSSSKKERGPATILSLPISVPAFRIRFVSADSKNDVTPRRVSISYIWEWLEYPYPERSRGAWVTAADVFTCDPHEVVEVAAYQVQPRGWYDGKYAGKPKFKGVLVTAGIERCDGRGVIHPGDVSKLRTNIAVFYVGCRGDSNIRLKKD